MWAKKIFKWRILSKEEKNFLRGFTYGKSRHSAKEEGVMYKDLFWNKKFIWKLMVNTYNKYSKSNYYNKMYKPTLYKTEFIDNELVIRKSDVSLEFLEEFKTKLKWYYGYFFENNFTNEITFKYFSKSRQIDSSGNYI